MHRGGLLPVCPCSALPSCSRDPCCLRWDVSIPRNTRALCRRLLHQPHHLRGFIGASSVAWAGHLVHVALPASRGPSIGWVNLVHQLPHPEGLKPFVSLNWAAYSSGPDQWNHVFGLADASVGTSVLSFLGTRMPSSDSLWLTDVAHHHLALGVLCIFLGNTVRAFSLNRDQCGLHWYLALALSLGHRSLAGMFWFTMPSLSACTPRCWSFRGTGWL